MIGKTLGQYVIEQAIGEGGMGVVYRARDTRLDRTVAVKVVSERTDTDPAGHARLLREARAASALNHPGVCTVHQVEEFDGQTVLVMEFVEGRPLSEAIPRTGFPLETVIRYGTQIADALAHAHARGVVHRDLKSQNVMVTAEDRIKILDFGLAKRGGAAVSDVTRSATTADAGTVAGTSGVHVARGAARRAGGCAQRHLGARHRPLRDDQRRTAVFGPDGIRADRRDHA